MASIVARCVPGSYDTLEDAAKGLAHATLACALLGTVGYLGTGYCAGIVAMQCLLLSAMANRNAGLLKVRRRVTVTVTWLRFLVRSVGNVRPSMRCIRRASFRIGFLCCDTRSSDVSHDES